MTQQKPQEQPREVFARYLRASGRRCTAERNAVLEAVLDTAGHFSAEQLRCALHSGGYPVSAATVYSSLELLVDCGLAARHRFSGNGPACSMYERITSAQAARSHHHLVCTVCGKISEMRDPELSALVNAKRFTGFTPAYFTLDIYGVCGACARRQRREARKKEKQ